MKAGEEKRRSLWRRSSLTALTVSVIQSFCLQAEGNWGCDDIKLFFAVVQTIVDKFALSYLVYFYSHSSITSTQSSYRQFLNLFLRGWVGRWKPEMIGTEIPIFPGSSHQNLILFPGKTPWFKNVILCAMKESCFLQPSLMLQLKCCSYCIARP